MENQTKLHNEAEILRVLCPTGITPDQYEEALQRLHAVTDVISKISIGNAQAPLAEATLNARQTDDDKLGALVRQSVMQKGTFAGRDAKVDGLTKGARKVADLIRSGEANTIKDLGKKTKYNRTYIYSLVKQLREVYGDHLTESRKGRSQTFALQH